MAKDDLKGASNLELGIKALGGAAGFLAFVGGLIYLRRRRLVRQIRQMVGVLNSIKASLQRMEIPREHAHEFLQLINLTDGKLGILAQRYPELGRVFQDTLVRIGDQLRHADVLIDKERAKLGAEYEFRPQEWRLHQPVTDVCAEIERAVGTLNAMLTVLEPPDFQKPPAKLEH